MKKNIILLLLVVLIAGLPAFGQGQKTISGIVKDQKNKEVLIGVTVVVAGTQRGTVTDMDGQFSLTVSDSQTKLIFSYLGYVTTEEVIGNRTKLSVEMRENAHIMEEVVVIGYGKQKKESVIGAISSLDNKTLVSIPVSNISQGLAGKMAGLQVVQPSGEVGRDEAELYIRGQSTWNNSKPLVIVDGIVRESFSQIDPNEVQSINILKDASATAVFGVKGANGVIIVTTKRGTSGKPSVSFTAQYAITQPVRIPDPLNAYQASVLSNTYQLNRYSGDEKTKWQILNYRTQASPYTETDTDWIDEVMKDYSTMQQYNINVTGGTDFVKYFISGGFLSQDGFYKHDDNTNFSKYNFRSNLDFNITKNFTAAFNLGARIENRTYPGDASYDSWNVYRAAFATGGRHSLAYNPDGSLAGTSDGGNIIGILENTGVFKETKSAIEMSLNLNYKLDAIVPGLSARAQIAFDNTGSNGKFWRQEFAVYQYNLANDTYKQFGEDTHLRYWNGDSFFEQKLYYEGGFEYNRTFDKHTVGGLFLANRDDRQIKNYINYRSQGLVGRTTYDFDKRYFGEFNIGYNGSENFASGNRYGIFPAVALGWMLSNEKFIAESSLANLISILKIRASIGWVGNDGLSGDKAKDDYQAGRFAYIQRYNNEGGASFGVGDNWNEGIRLGNIANVNLGWEVARKSNIGFESSFWNDLIGLNIDFFYEYRDKILTGISNITPEYVGASFAAFNVGKTENKGIEIELSHRYKFKEFDYFVKGNFSYVRNKIIKKSDPAGALDYQKEAGYPIGTPNVYKQIGYFQDYDDIYSSPSQLGLSGNQEVYPGDLKYLDFNNDGIIDYNDAFRQGYGSVPEIQYGLTLGANWKNFNFSVLFQGSAHAQFSKNWEIMWHFSNSDNVYDKHWHYWTPETGDKAAEYTRLYGSYQNNEPAGSQWGSTYSYGSGDYVRVKNAEIGYTLPSQWTKKVYMSNVKLYVSGNNLWLWAKEPYIDPDNRDSRGKSMPQTRAVNFGVNINF